MQWQKGKPDYSFVCRNLSICPKDVKTKCYKSIVSPQIEYASTVWDKSQHCQIERVGKPSETDSVKSQVSSETSRGKKDSTKRRHQRHHQRLPGEQQFPIQVVLPPRPLTSSRKILWCCIHTTPNWPIGLGDSYGGRVLFPPNKFLTCTLPILQTTRLRGPS